MAQPPESFKVDLKGKVCVITGASDGIGVPTAMTIAKTGAHTILAVRNLEKGQKVADNIKQESGNANVEVMKLDLSSFASVRNFADEFRRKSLPLNLLINNAGLFLTSYTKTDDGFESQLQVNHLSHFLLTNLLMDIIVESAPSRIINVSSDSHLQSKGLDWENLNGEKQPNPSGVQYWYAQSKICNVYFTRELQRRFKEQGVNVVSHSLHPGSLIPTNIAASSPFYVKAFFGIVNFLGFSKTVEQGSWTTLVAALYPQYQTEGGLYFRDCKPVEPSKVAQDDEAAKKLWDVSETLTQLK